MTTEPRGDDEHTHSGGANGTSTRTGAILVVEDSLDIGAMLASALEEEGYRVHVVRSGVEVLDEVAAFQPDLITLDLGLPERSGWEVLADLRRDPSCAHIPIIAVSGREVGAEIEAQVARVIHKPFYVSDVVDSVLDVLGTNSNSNSNSNSNARRDV